MALLPSSPHNLLPSSPFSPRLAPSNPPRSVDSPSLLQLSNHPEAPAPMSVLEWRRAVWFQVQSFPPPSSPQTCSVNKFQHHHPKSHNWALEDSSSNSDSSHDLSHAPSNTRPARFSTLPPSKKTGLVPLIDLSQPSDADGRPIQFEDGCPKLVSQSNKPKNRIVLAPDIEQRHRKAMRRLQAEATEQLIFAEWEANHQRFNSSHFEKPSLHRHVSRKAPLQKLSDFARRSVSNLSIKTSAIDFPPRTSISGATTPDNNRIKRRFSISTKSNHPDLFNKNTTKNRFSRLIKKIGTITPSSLKPNNRPLSSSPESEASVSRKSLLSTLRFSTSTPAFHP